MSGSQEQMLILGLVADLAVVMGISALGALTARAMLPNGSRLERLGLAFPLGGGLLTFVAFLVSWAGLQLDLLSLVSLWVILLSLAWGLPQIVGRPGPETEDNSDQLPQEPAPRELRGRQGLPLRIALIVFLSLGAVAAVLAIGRSHSSYDAAAMWIIKGYGIVQEGSIFGARHWGAHGLAYPLNIHLLVALFRLTSADRVPGSQLIYLMFYGSTAIVVLAYWIRRQVAPILCGLGLLFLASVPVMFLHSTVGFPNLPMAFYVVAGATYGMEGLAGGRMGSRLLGGTLLGMGSWTIIEGFQYSGVVLVLIALAAAWDSGPRLREYALLAAPYVLITGVWLVFYNRYGASGSQAIGALNAMVSGIKTGAYNLVELRLIFGYMRRYLFEVNTWGVLFSVGGLILLLGALKLRDALLPEAFTLVLLFAGTGALTCALFYLRSFVTSDFLAWLIRGFPRGFLCSTIFFAMAVILVAPPSAMEPRQSGDAEL